MKIDPGGGAWVLFAARYGVAARGLQPAFSLPAGFPLRARATRCLAHSVEMPDSASACRILLQHAGSLGFSGRHAIFAHSFNQTGGLHDTFHADRRNFAVTIIKVG